MRFWVYEVVAMSVDVDELAIKGMKHSQSGFKFFRLGAGSA